MNHKKELADEVEKNEKLTKKCQDLALRNVELVKERTWCQYSGEGRGDCMHFIGLPSTFEHPKDVDEYGIPHGWCAYCWCSYERDKFNNELSVIKQHRQGTCPTLDKGLFHKTLGDDFHIDYETRVKIWNFISTHKPSVEMIAEIVLYKLIEWKNMSEEKKSEYIKKGIFLRHVVAQAIVDKWEEL